MPTATLFSKGRITLPRQVRQALGVVPGDRLDFTIEASGRVLVRAATNDVAGLRGLLHRPGRRSVTLRQMDATMRRQPR